VGVTDKGIVIEAWNEGHAAGMKGFILIHRPFSKELPCFQLSGRLDLRLLQARVLLIG
jgi:hypothetical protein